VNRENNMVDPQRWLLWLELLEYARTHGEVMTMGDYALAVATDNCPGLSNADQADADADGRGDVCDVERIDIKPGSDTNPINPRSRGLVPVAIIGTGSLDVTNVQVETLAFGPGGAPPAHGGHLGDLNGDGLTDLLTHHSTALGAISPGSTHACLRGEIAGTPFVACDSIVTVPRR
jgi:hypothetical protein